MVTLKIKPISTQTTGGYDAKITGLNINEQTPIFGKINTPGAGAIDVNWDMNGMAENQSDKCNLNTTSNEFNKVRDALQKFR